MVWLEGERIFHDYPHLIVPCKISPNKKGEETAKGKL